MFKTLFITQVQNEISEHKKRLKCFRKTLKSFQKTLKRSVENA